LEILTVGTAKRAKLHHHAHFMLMGQIVAEIWGIFQFFEMADRQTHAGTDTN